MHLPKGIPTASKPNVPLPGYQGGTVSEDPGLHTSPTVLGGEVQPTDTWPIMPFGKVHARTEEGNGTICGLLQQGHPRGCHIFGEVPGSTNSGNHPCEDPVSSTEVPNEVAAPTKEPTEVIAPTEVSTEEVDLIEFLLKCWPQWRFLPKNQLLHWLPSVGK